MDVDTKPDAHPLSDPVVDDDATFVLPGDWISTLRLSDGGLWIDVYRNGTTYARIVVDYDGTVIGAVHYYPDAAPDP